MHFCICVQSKILIYQNELYLFENYFFILLLTLFVPQKIISFIGLYCIISAERFEIILENIRRVINIIFNRELTCEI